MLLLMGVHKQMVLQPLRYLLIFFKCDDEWDMHYATTISFILLLNLQLSWMKHAHSFFEIYVFLLGFIDWIDFFINHN